MLVITPCAVNKRGRIRTMFSQLRTPAHTNPIPMRKNKMITIAPNKNSSIFPPV